MEDLVQAQKEYIKFLEREVSNLSLNINVYGWMCPKEVIEEGEKLRLKINEFSAKTK